jgi:hypothetical protein
VNDSVLAAIVIDQAQFPAGDIVPDFVDGSDPAAPRTTAAGAHIVDIFPTATW